MKRIFMVDMDGGREVFRWRILRWIPYLFWMHDQRARARRIAFFFEVKRPWKPEELSKWREEARWIYGLETEEEKGH